MKNLQIATIAVCVALLITGCNAFQPTQSPTIRATVEEQSTPLPSPVPTTEPQSTAPNTPTSTTVGSPNQTLDRESRYTEQFRTLLKNKSLDITQFDLKYNIENVPQPETLNVTSVQVIEGGVGDQRTAIVRNSVSSSDFDPKIVQSHVQIMAVYAQVTKRVVENSGEWNVSELKIVTDTPRQTVSARVDQSAAVQIHQEQGYTFGDYYSWYVGSYHNESGTDAISTRDHIDDFQANLEVITVDSNITDIKTIRSGGTVYVTYTTTTSPDASLTRVAEYLLVTREYGMASLKHNFGVSNVTDSQLVLEEIYQHPNGTYDTRGSYFINQSIGRQAATGGLTSKEFIEYIDGRSWFEDGQLSQ
jgi:hypothetical protein